MPRRKRFEKVTPMARDKIERLCGLVRSEIHAAQTSLVPFNAHYEALSQLSEDMHRAVNVLSDRDPQWREMHAPALSGRQS